MATVILSCSAIASADDSAFDKTVKPFLNTHCVRCHSGTKPKGGLSLLNAAAGAKKTWRAIGERLILREMPPEGEKQPDAKSRTAVVGWIKSQLKSGGLSAAEKKLALPVHGNRVNHDSLFNKPASNIPTASPPRLWRVSPKIYDTFLRQATRQRSGQKSSVGQPFSVAAGEGFKDYSALYVIDEPTINQLFRNAKQIVEMQSGNVRGGRVSKEIKAVVNPKQEPTRAQINKAIVKQYETVLHRRPTDDETKRFLKLWDKNVKDAGRIVGGKATLATVFLLPEALYRYELGRRKVDPYGRRMLAPRELAYAIAFALSDTAPDGQLLKAAREGKLATRDDVRREVMRIFANKKLEKTRVMRFFEEYFEFNHTIEVFKDIKRGQWRPQVLVEDTRHLIRYILERDKDVLKELLTTNKSFVNYKIGRRGKPEPARLTREGRLRRAGKLTKRDLEKMRRRKKRQPEMHDWYSLPQDWEWAEKQPIELPKNQRAGILTQPSWLTGFATNNENHAIRRGKWIRERLLGGVVPDLPISVDAQLPDAPHQTLRQRMQITSKTYCWQCHRKMNPLGLTFENYDYLGRFRTKEKVVDPNAPPKKSRKKGQPPEPVYHEVAIDSTGKVAFTGVKSLDGDVKNAVELMHKLAKSDRVRQVFIRHAFRYWMGRNETVADAAVLQAADKAYVKSGGSMRALIVSLLTSDAFLFRREPANSDTKK